jgi:uncharacterized RmlC-like cupin family protein
MEQARPIVTRPSQGAVAPGPPTPGMDRRQILDHANVWVGWVRTDAGLAGGWHHHGDRETYVYVVSGTLTIEYGPGGRERVEATAGDLIFNPARMVHRETTAPDGPAEAFVVRVGPGPQNVNVDGPDP